MANQTNLIHGTINVYEVIAMFIVLTHQSVSDSLDPVYLLDW